MRKVAGLVLLALAAVLVGCPPKQYLLTYRGVPPMNVRDGESVPVRVMVFQLKTVEKFDAAKDAELWTEDAAKAALGDSLSGPIQEIDVQPSGVTKEWWVGTKRERNNILLEDGTKFVAFFAKFAVAPANPAERRRWVQIEDAGYGYEFTGNLMRLTLKKDMPQPPDRQ